MYHKMEEESLTRNNEMSCCVVWTPIPILSWLCPAIGHVGVTDSNGITYDFQGPYYIGKGNMIFGNPRQKWKVDVDPEVWDSSIERVTQQFGHINYNILCSNCHYYVAAVLEEAGIKQFIPFKGKWYNGATIQVIWALILKARSLSVGDFLVIWIPFLILIAIILLFAFLV